MKKCSGVNQERNLHRSSTVYEPEQLETNMWLRFDVRDNNRWTFSLEEALLWIMDSYFGRKLRVEVKKILMDLFLNNTHILSSQDVNWWTGVVWIIVMFLSAVWTLILTAPIHCRGSFAQRPQLHWFNQIHKSDKDIVLFIISNHLEYQTVYALKAINYVCCAKS